MTLAPATGRVSVTDLAASPRLEFDLHLFEKGSLDVDFELAPTLDFKGDGGMKFAVSLDGVEPVVINVHEQLTQSDWSEAHWEAVVARNAHRISLNLPVEEIGAQTLTFWPMDAALVFQRVIVSQQTLPESYLGPPALVPR